MSLEQEVKQEAEKVANVLVIGAEKVETVAKADFDALEQRVEKLTTGIEDWIEAVANQLKLHGINIPTVK